MECLQIREGLIVNTPYVLVTYTTGFGNVPESTSNFLKNNSNKMVGVASSGNRNWGSNFAKAARIITEKYGVPNILEFELSGTKLDIDTFKERLRDIEIH